MGLVGKLVCGGLIVGAFFVGVGVHKTRLNDVYRYIDRNPKEATQIFTYTKNKLEVTNPSFLESLNMNSLNEDQRKEIAEDYIKSKLKNTYEEGSKSLQDFYNNLQRLLSGSNSD
jgi:hypothetical protein